MDWDKEISDRAEYLPKLTIAKFLKIAEEDKSVVSLGPGAPDFNPPKTVMNYAAKLAQKGENRYSPVGGRTETKEAFADYLKRNNKIKLSDPEKQVIVTTGSSEAILLSLMVLIDPGEEVIVPDPGFLSYKPSVYMLNGAPVPLPLMHEENFDVDPDELENRLSVKTRAIILNTPSNPTGTVLRTKVLDEILDIAIDNDLLIISDEAYERLVYGKSKHVSIGSLNGAEDHVLTLHSTSKTFAMPGFRCGFAAGPEKLIEKMVQLHISTTLTAPTFGQKCAAYALRSKGLDKNIEKMRKEYDRRRKMIVKRLHGMPGFDISNPEGAFYAFPKFDFKMSSYDLSMWLLKNAKVACIPGTEFGSFGEGFIRMSYATSYDRIVEAMDRIESALPKLKK
ncbi:MAG: pyridoxal phosphate-dependent aminotransferase [Candidatus Diapherotrites archaeon]|nr:pyridoxal phosphate-dependent aminotransferase [Candidatus Diapherotrites archaeon]